MKQVKIQELISSYSQLKDISARSFSPSITYKLLTALKEVTPLVETYEETRNKCLKSNTVEKDSGVEFKSDEDKKEFIEKMEALVNETVELPVKTIKLKELLNDGTKVSALEIYKLQWLIDGEV